MLTLSPPLGLQHTVLPALYCLALNALLAPVHCGYPRLQSSTAQWVWNGAGSLEFVWKSVCVCVWGSILTARCSCMKRILHDWWLAIWISSAWSGYVLIWLSYHFHWCHYEVFVTIIWASDQTQPIHAVKRVPHQDYEIQNCVGGGIG